MKNPSQIFLWALFSAFLSFISFVEAEQDFELVDGDVVAFLGDTFIEREQYHGWMELAATTAFPDRKVKFRNLGWSADTPAGESRRGLSLYQAGLEPEDEGWRQLLEQLETYQPSVIILGYGTASSLKNGESDEEFQKNLNRLLDEAPKVNGKNVRFVILGSPPRFESKYTTSEELSALDSSRFKIEQILIKTAKDRNIPFVSLDALAGRSNLSDNGLHFTAEGYKAAAELLGEHLGWTIPELSGNEAAEMLRQHIIRKNEWFFHRSRPANTAYIFGFRSKEQGQIAGEIKEFESYIEREEAAIAQSRDLTKNVIVPAFPIRNESIVAKEVTQERPEFEVAEGFEVSLWAENPMLHKPTQVNFDPQGRLWVASAETYPQIEVGQTPNDKVIILSDSNGDGTADEATVFADGLSMPTGILPDASGGAYVGQSTDLLHFQDEDSDGVADSMERTLSGFGTEDTHHNLHTLRRGLDGTIWMNQSIYTRSNIETPHGIVRLDSGGVFRFDPRTLKLDIVYRGMYNSWGHQFDQYGQSMLTDGAGYAGVLWGFPQVMLQGYARSENVLGAISPGAYPKFCGLEIIGSDHFPADWQGNLVTGDYRAHRVVRFTVADDGAGFVTQEKDDLLRSGTIHFRPIDMKTGPDGALYIADWANPVINHGEVDFRDPRRDREHGRIWKVTRKDAALKKAPDFPNMDAAALQKLLGEKDPFLREQAAKVLLERQPSVTTKVDDRSEASQLLAALRMDAINRSENFDHVKAAYASPQGEIRTAAIRHLASFSLSTERRELLSAAITDPFPRVRLEAILALGKESGAAALRESLQALSSDRDRFIDYALWLHIQRSGAEWLAELSDETAPEEIAFVLGALPTDMATETVSRLFPDELPADLRGPWLELGLASGNEKVLKTIFQEAASNKFSSENRERMLGDLFAAVNARGLSPALDSGKLIPYLADGGIAAIRMAGFIGAPSFVPSLSERVDSSEIGIAAVNALSQIKGLDSRDALLDQIGTEQDMAVRIAASVALGRHHRDLAVPSLAVLAREINEPEQSRTFWQQVLSLQGVTEQLAERVQENPLDELPASLALRNIPDSPEHKKLLDLLKTQAGSLLPTEDIGSRIAEIMEASKEGDPDRGERVYRRPALACIACHAIGGVGGAIGPDMTSIGSSAPLDYLIESVIAPNAKIKEGYHSIRIQTTDGRSVSGTLLSTVGGALKIRDATGAEITIAKAQILEQVDSDSLMPAGLIDSLDDKDTADLFAFMSQLGKPGNFSANDSESPKFYAAIGRSKEYMDAAVLGDPSLPWAIVPATINGRMLPADYYSAGVPKGRPILATKLQLTEETDVDIHFADGFRATGLFINGKSTTGKETLPAGIHTIVFLTDGLREPIRLISKEGTFLPNW